MRRGTVHARMRRRETGRKTQKTDQRNSRGLTSVVVEECRKEIF